MAETATLEQTQVSTPDTSADVQAPASDDVQPPASTQEPSAGAEEQAEASQEKKAETPRTLEEIDAAIKVAGSKYRAVKDGAITDADAERHDEAQEKTRQSNQDRVNTLNLQRQQAAEAGQRAQANYAAVMQRIQSEVMPEDVAQGLQNEAAAALVTAAGDWRMTEARMRFIETLALVDGGDELAAKASRTRASLEDLAAQFVPTVIEKAKSEQLQDLRDGKLAGYRLMSTKDINELEKAARNEAKADSGGTRGTVSGDPSGSGPTYKTQLEADVAHAAGLISNAERRRIKSDARIPAR